MVDFDTDSEKTVDKEALDLSRILLLSVTFDRALLHRGPAHIKMTIKKYYYKNFL